MKLDEKERRVLGYVHLKADATLAEISSACSLKSHTVRYILDSLLKHDILKPNVIINKRALGFFTACGYFNFNPAFNSKREEILKAMEKSLLCSWLCPVVGDYEYGFALGIKSFDQINYFFQGLCNEFGSFLKDRTFAVDNKWYYFGKKYLLLLDKDQEPIVIDGSLEDLKIDKIDEQILNLIIKNPLASESLICKELDMPTSTINSRIARMKKQKIIAGCIYTLNYAKANISAYRIIVDLGGPSVKILDQVVKFATAHPNVISMDTCSGNYDLEMSVEYQDSHSIKYFLEEFRGIFKDEIQSLKVLNRLDDRKSYILSPLAFSES